MKYYSTQRPLMPGSFPVPKINQPKWWGCEILEIKNFDNRMFVPEINRQAWGFIEYSCEIPADEADAYELVPVEKNKN